MVRPSSQDISIKIWSGRRRDEKMQPKFWYCRLSRIPSPFSYCDFQEQQFKTNLEVIEKANKTRVFLDRAAKERQFYRQLSGIYSLKSSFQIANLRAGAN